MYTYDNKPKTQTTKFEVFTQDVSPYELINILNTTYKLELPTQMGYNYTRKGMIDGLKRESCKGVKIDKDAANKWAEKYLTKNHKI